MKFRIAHLTRYSYDAPLLGECFMEARLRPLTVPGEQVCREYAITVTPSVPVFGYDQLDQMGLVNHFVLRHDPHLTLTVQASSVVDTLRPNPFEGLNLLAEDWPLLAERPLHEQFAEFLAPTELVPLFGSWPGPLPDPAVLRYGQLLSDEIYTQFQYVPGATDISTPLSEFVAQRRGVCQDYAHLMLSAVRSRGVPARYVSGYVAGGHGAGATHAWVELYLPHAQTWRGFDPTNNVLVADRHIKVAVGRDYSDVPPTKGLLRAAVGNPLPSETNLEVDVQVEEIG